VGDGLEFLRGYRFRGDELVYCDPPYMRSLCSSPSRYKFVLDDRDHLELLKLLRGLEGRTAAVRFGSAPCFVMVSGYWCELYADMLAGWRSITFDAMTRGGLRRECLWFNFPAPSVLHDYRYLGADYRERERIKRKTL
jgi:DNA adenine methylase